ncbi:signal peptidase I [Patescibacteria group bacterium]|nr:signal peptidase I [Patescibacteria group bacterium]
MKGIITQAVRSKVFVLLSVVLLLFLLLFPFASIAGHWLGWDIYFVQGGSMEPILRPGDLILTKPTEVKHIDRGDIIVFWSESKDGNIVHRVVDVRQNLEGKEGPWFQTKGDAVRIPDQEFVYSSSGEVSTVRFYLPYVGFMLEFSEAGSFVLLLVLGVVLWRRIRESNKVPA